MSSVVYTNLSVWLFNRSCDSVHLIKELIFQSLAFTCTCVCTPYIPFDPVVWMSTMYALNTLFSYSRYTVHVTVSLYYNFIILCVPFVIL